MFIKCKERSPVVAQQQANKKAPRTFITVLLPLLCTLVALVLAGGYFFAEKLEAANDDQLRTGSLNSQDTATATGNADTTNALMPQSLLQRRQEPSHADEQWAHLTNSVTHCPGEYAYAGTNGTDYVSICKQREGLLYQAYVANGILRRSAVEEAPGRWRADAGTHTIVVQGDRVDVLDARGVRKSTVDLPHWRQGS